jgi:hypothetical protein
MTERAAAGVHPVRSVRTPTNGRGVGVHRMTTPDRVPAAWRLTGDVRPPRVGEWFLSTDMFGALRPMYCAFVYTADRPCLILEPSMSPPREPA